MQPEATDIYQVKLKKYPHLEKDDWHLKETNRNILEKQSKMWNVLFENIDVFSLHDDIGDVKHSSIKIDLTDETPFFVRPYSINASQRELIQKEIS